MDWGVLDNVWMCAYCKIVKQRQLFYYFTKQSFFYMRLLLILSLVFLFSLSISAQTKLNAEQQKTVIETMDKAASKVKTMQCEFLQIKTMKMLKREMKSQGKMFFSHPDKLRWQYTVPYNYTFLMNGDKVVIKSSRSTQKIDVQKNKMFRQITTIIFNSITGGGLKSTADFNVELYKDNQSYFAKLYPKKKELKQVYEVIEIFFNDSLTMVSGVKMKEKTGDVTTVKLNNVIINTTISDSTFSIN